MDRIIITITLVILLSLPFMILNTKVSKWLTTTLRAENKKEKKENTMSQNIFILLTLLHVPLIALMVYTNPYRMIYGFVYIASAIALLLGNPWGIITDSKVATFVYVFATFFAYLTMFTQPYAWLHLICIFVLCISFTNVIQAYTDHKEFLTYFILYTIPYCISYLFALRPSLLQVAQNMFKPGESTPIQMNLTLTLCVFFFVLLFYSSTLFNNYYGTPLISEPIPLVPSVEYKITPSYEYTLSYWVYMDAVPPEYNSLSAFNANLVSSGYSLITEYDSSNQKLYVVTKEPVRNTLEIDMYPQRWNHVVVVCNHGTLDVYLNGEVVGTTHSISSTEEYLLVGEPEGSKGKICSLVYSTKAFTPLMISQLYFQLKSHNPPVL